MKKLLIIASLFSFFFIAVLALQEYSNDTIHTKNSLCDSPLEQSIEKAPQYTALESDSDALPSKLIKNLYKEFSYPTPNIDMSRKNSVEGVVLHHTAEPTVERSLEVLTSSTKRVGTHCVIDTDGTRYIMCDPEVVTFHAGFSVLNGKEGCNNFTIGIEFQGNTLEAPLTQDQMNSAIEYLRPIIEKYDIPYSNIVTHEMIRQAYKKKHPKKRCSGKVDITQTEYKRFMKLIKKVYDEK